MPSRPAPPHGWPVAFARRSLTSTRPPMVSSVAESRPPAGIGVWARGRPNRVAKVLPANSATGVYASDAARKTRAATMADAASTPPGWGRRSCRPTSRTSATVNLSIAVSNRRRRVAPGAVRSISSEMEREVDGATADRSAVRIASASGSNATPWSTAKPRSPKSIGPNWTGSTPVRRLPPALGASIMATRPSASARSTGPDAEPGGTSASSRRRSSRTTGSTSTDRGTETDTRCMPFR